MCVLASERKREREIERGRERVCMNMYVCPSELCFVCYCRLCVVMLVKDATEYNNTVTRAFRELSMSSHSKKHISFGYVDVAKQEEFVEMFGKIPNSLRMCEKGSKTRPVSDVCRR